MTKKSLHTNNTKDTRMRLQLAQEAARLIAEEGIKDFHAAKQKAALRLHAPHTHNLPRNDEVQHALKQYQRLFKENSQPQHLRHLRKAAHKLMTFFESFEPRLVGSVVDGSANEHSDINLHLFADSVEEISIFLINQHIPYELESQYITQTNGDAIELPGFSLIFEDIDVQLTIFECKELHHAPRCPINGKPMQRVNINRIDELLQQSSN
ncbi:hypothetical protein ACFL2V_10465 [Pseudomonadota bacterium]